MGKVTFDLRHADHADATTVRQDAVLAARSTLKAATVVLDDGNAGPLFIFASVEERVPNNAVRATIQLPGLDGVVLRSTFQAQQGSASWTGEIPICRDFRTFLTVRARNDNGVATPWSMSWVTEGRR